MTMLRPIQSLLAGIAVAVVLTAPSQAESFSAFLKAFRPQAIAAGVKGAVYDLSTAGLTPDPAIPKLVETQPEFSTPVWSYLGAPSSWRAEAITWARGWVGEESMFVRGLATIWARR